jgi:hypothetical protein
MAFPINVQTRWLDFSPALRWYTARKVECSLQPYASRIRSVTVRITDIDTDLDSRNCLIHVIVHPRTFVSASAIGGDACESVERAVHRVRTTMRQRLGTEAERSDVSRAA